MFTSSNRKAEVKKALATRARGCAGAYLQSLKGEIEQLATAEDGDPFVHEAGITEAPGIRQSGCDISGRVQAKGPGHALTSLPGSNKKENPK